jgi:adenosylmethionine-8-amino-7-oxononanoate aminotransferase
MIPKTALWPLLTPFHKHGKDSFNAVSAEGVRVRFADGTEKLCGTSGLWNANLGYGNLAIAEAASRALREASYLTVWGFENEYARKAADALIQLAGPSYKRVVFSTSGGAANDAAMKLARHFHALANRSDRKIILGLKHGYHGLTFGAFALSDVSLGQQLYGVDRRLVGHVSAEEPEALDIVLDRIGGAVAAVFVEPVIGNGTLPLSDEFLRILLARREEFGYLVVADEIATGFGRVGPTIFASRLWPAPPDILLAAKGMTNGTQAASAILVSDPVFEAFRSRNALFGHAETQAGTPVVCASILATISEMVRLDALERGARLGEALDCRLRSLVGHAPLVVGTRGKGCMRSLLLAWPDGSDLAATDVEAIVEAIRVAGALVHPGRSAIQLLPALVYSSQDLDLLLGFIYNGLGSVEGSKRV